MIFSKKNLGITLIALVITIVVLVILSAVVISMTVGNDGLIAKAIKAANDYKNSKTKEEQAINDMYGELLVASDGTIQNLTPEKLSDLIKTEVKNQIKDLDTTPVGTIIAYSKDSLPSDDYVKCDGSAISRTEYSELFEKIGTTYGEGDGSTTFNVPDLRGEFLRGTGTNSHANQGNGATVGKHQDATFIPNYRSWYKGTGSNIGVFLHNSEGGNGVMNADSSNYGIQYLAYSNTTMTSGTGEKASSKLSTRPTNTSVLYCIKAK